MLPPLLTDPLFVAAAVVAVTCLGISKGGFIGFGVIAAPLLSLIVPPLQAVAILLPILLTQDVVSVWIYRREWSAWNLTVLVPGCAAGVVVATLVAASFSVPATRLMVGAIALLFVASRLAAPWLERHAPRPGAISGLFWGAVSGFVSTIANAGSPPYQIHMLPQRLPPFTFVGTTTLFFAASNLMKVPAYSALGTLTWDNVSVGIVLLPLAVATNFLGVWLLRRTPAERFYKIAYVLVLLVGLELIRSGLAGLM